MSSPTTTHRLPDETGQRISAYLDGELSPDESKRVEALLAEDPAARRFADELRDVGRACHSLPAPAPTGDLSQQVLAEALRRRNAATPPETRVDRLEPEGEFGLPFRGISNTWAWAGFAVAAALLIGFFGRPAPRTTEGTLAARGEAETTFEALRDAAPGVRVVDFQATPQMLAALQQRLALQAPQQARLPNELMAVSQRGLVVEPTAGFDPNEDEHLLYVDADEAEVDRLLSEVRNGSDGLIRVGSQPGASAPPVQPAQPPHGPRAVRLRLQVRPDGAVTAAPTPGATTPIRSATGAPRKLVLLRIKLRPQP